MQQCKNTGFSLAACLRSALYRIKAHLAIAYTETLQSCHECMQVSSYTTYKFWYKHYALCNVSHPSVHTEANQANYMPFTLKENGLLYHHQTALCVEYSVFLDRILVVIDGHLRVILVERKMFE